MKLHAVSSIFAALLTVSLSAPAQQTAAQSYANWAKALPYVKTAADWYYGYDTKLAAIVANKYDEYFAPKFEDNAAGYEAERQYYERRVKTLEPYEGRLKILEAAGQLSQAMLAKDPDKALIKLAQGYGYFIATDPQTRGDVKMAVNQVEESAAGVVGVFSGQSNEIESNSTAQMGQTISAWDDAGQSVSDWSGTTNQTVQSTNDATQAWSSQNDGGWQCLPSQWNSQNSPVVWPGKP